MEQEDGRTVTTARIRKGEAAENIRAVALQGAPGWDVAVSRGSGNVIYTVMTKESSSHFCFCVFVIY